MRKITRREFLRVAAGSGGAFMAAGLGVKSTDNLIPYIISPEDIRPSVVTYFATTCRECPAGCGMIAWNRDGRVTKVEGNPDHPVNRGGLCARGQSAVQGLYDPDRVRGPMHRPQRGGPAQPVEWRTAVAEISKRLAAPGAKVTVVSDLQTGALAEVMQQFAAGFGQGEAVYFEPLDYSTVRRGRSKIQPGPIPDYRIDLADYLISFGVDFLETWISPVQFARRFAEMRSSRPSPQPSPPLGRGSDATPLPLAGEGGRRPGEGRFVYVGPRLSMTAANADEFIQVPAGRERAVAMGMLAAIEEKKIPYSNAGQAISRSESLACWALESAAEAAGVPEAVIERLAREFCGARAPLSLARPAGAEGEEVRKIADAAATLNSLADCNSKTVDFSRPHALSRAVGRTDLAAHLEKIGAGDVLVVHNCNPVFAMPGAAQAIGRAGLVVCLGTMMDETAALADWVLPVDSPLESWGEYQPVTDVLSLMQPTMGRIHNTRAAGDILLALARAADAPLRRMFNEKPAADFKSWLQAAWKDLGKILAPSKAAEAFWQDSLRAGGWWSGPLEERPVATRGSSGTVLHNAYVLTEGAPGEFKPAADEAALWLWPSVFLFDGRHANRGWLQEAPDPTTHAVWGSWIDIHPSKAKALGIADGDILELSSKAGKVEAPARVTADVHESTVALAFGQGHTALGRNAKGRGANAFSLLGLVNPGPFGQVAIKRTGRRLDPVLASSGVQDQGGREIIQWVAAEKLATMKPGEGTPLILPLPEGYRADKDLYAPHEYKEHRWAMVVDLSRCTGCGACAVACYAENNVAVVGAERVERGHHMPWLQVVPYREGEDARRLGFLPLMCQHCDAAPCEPVCPVYASVHNDEGLNAQVYNRCVGTRYCMNNCPYKVRRFNWWNYAFEKPLDWQLNPEVTVRVRGVMEKCTFCIQRIRAAELRAKREDRKLRDGEVQPACVQSCPTRAYTFGDLLDPEARVTKLTRLDPRRYHVLEELNTKPGVAYLRRIKDI